MNINICLMQPAGHPHALALLEAAEYLFFATKRTGFEVTLQKNRISHVGLNIIFGAHINPESNLNLPLNTVIFNTEQLTENNVLNDSYKILLNQFFVWDYSNTNLDVLKHHNKELINFFHIEALNRIPKILPHQYDLIFYGSINERRKNILENLAARGLKIKHVFGLYSKERDFEIAKARAVLNLHFYDSQIFQQIRAFYPLSNQIPVISENFPRESAPDIYQECIFTPNNENFIDYVTELLKNSAEFESNAKYKIDKFLATSSNQEFSLSLEKTIAKLKPSADTVAIIFDRMNLGSGKDYRRNYLNIDLREDVLPDLIFDLSQNIDFPISCQSRTYGIVEFKENQFKEIIANDVLEHVPNLETLMGNCLAILQEGGRFLINVPYDLSLGAWQDPTHIRAFNQNSWLYYTDWFWYLGWFDFRFELTELKFNLSQLGQRLASEKCSQDTIFSTPRAVDSMQVILTKKRTSPEEKSLARSYANRLNLEVN